jgi:quercetin dioxygenase-like cupin family protein
MRTVHIIEADKTPEPVNVVGEAITILAGGDTTKPFEVHIQEGVQGGGPPPHFHPWDEAFYVMDGQVEVEFRSYLPGTGCTRIRKGD